MADQREPGLRIWLGGKPLERLSQWVLQLEVDERADEASTFRMTVDMSPIEAEETGDWDVIEHGVFAELQALPELYLLQRVTIEFSLISDDEAEPAIAATVFDGFITCVEPVFGEYRVPDSKLIVSGIDASCLMHIETVTREWHGKTDAEIAKDIFGKYGFAADDTTVEATTPKRELTRSTLVQRCTDAEFLRMLARRNGFEVYVEPADGEVAAGPHPGRTVKGYFRSPLAEAKVQPALALFPRETPSLIEFRARWESHQPTHIRAWTIDEATRRIERTDTKAPDYPRLGEFDRAKILDKRLGEIFGTGTRPDPVDIQSADVPHDSLELGHLARADYRIADWLVTGTGTVRAERYPAIVRPRRPIELKGAGHLLDGRWYMLGVRHRWGIDPERPEEEQTDIRYEPDITMVRNGLGGLRLMAQALRFPFRISDRGTAAVAGRPDIIRQQLEQLLFTIPGERVGRPGFGCGIQRLVFAGITAEAIAAAEYVISTAIRRTMAELVQLDAVRVEAEETLMRIDILYTVVETGDEPAQSFEHPLEAPS